MDGSVIASRNASGFIQPTDSRTAGERQLTTTAAHTPISAVSRMGRPQIPNEIDRDRRIGPSTLSRQSRIRKIELIYYIFDHCQELLGDARRPDRVRPR